MVTSHPPQSSMTQTNSSSHCCSPVLMPIATPSSTSCNTSNGQTTPPHIASLKRTPPRCSWLFFFLLCWSISSECQHEKTSIKCLCWTLQQCLARASYALQWQVWGVVAPELTSLKRWLCRWVLSINQTLYTVFSHQKISFYLSVCSTFLLWITEDRL